jgi:dTDP-glucose pyrophosphorylase
LTYGDILVHPQTYQHMLTRFAEAPFAGLVTVIRGEDVSKGAINLFDKDFCLRRLIEKPSHAQLEELRQQGELKPGAIAWYNAGVYIFKPLVFDFTACLQKSIRGEYELTDAISAMVEAKHRIAGLEIQGRWVDVRDPQVLAALERDANA